MTRYQYLVGKMKPTCARSGSSTSGVYSLATRDKSDSPHSINLSTEETAEQKPTFT